MKALYRLFYYISILLTVILAIFTLAGAFSGSTSPDSAKLLPFIGLILPILLLMNLAVAIYWIIRWRCWLFIPLIAIVGNWAYLSSILQFPLFDSAAEPKTNMAAEQKAQIENKPNAPTETNQKTQTKSNTFLTLATYNVDSFNQEHTGFSCKEIAEYMKNLGVDIFCFQEFGINKEFGVDSLYTAFSEWSYHYIPSSPEGEQLLQLAVFSRYPIKDQQLITYPESDNCSLWCDIEINERTIRLFNNHLQTTDVSSNKRKLVKELNADNSDRVEYAVITLTNGLHNNFKKRAAQAEQINQLITVSPYPTLVCGDLNSLPSSYTYRTIKGNLNDGFQTCGHGYMYTFHYFKHLLRIDYIFHSHEFEGVDYFSPYLNYSDHNPVVMKMKW
ncbi:endonuclease/exonuclease/phosphatase family protein [Bacteroides sp.]|uniref:endonuclease/exonuclease/phosphatase family protein n=1 Tax=Bacteroides sp. TaxID=29523 RepID=UPI0026159ECA|nr:endonuclease/exonuclease/phosphatase family protein [Bacteroides sp.]MDD3037768.1 endonuclease/exonuclease/phosphatase family protein [Bacteroides sp.]